MLCVLIGTIFCFISFEVGTFLFFTPYLSCWSHRQYLYKAEYKSGYFHRLMY
ncbi:hypothetical protein BDF14DRAFT_1785258 [Spinellus fusiger]|nr:hypothetical protein BDF14DRAFT_1785258 [Spinellus fusiger]